MDRGILSPEEIEALLGSTGNDQAEDVAADVGPDAVAELFGLAYDSVNPEGDSDRPLLPTAARVVTFAGLVDELEGQPIKGLVWRLSGAAEGDLVLFVTDASSDVLAKLSSSRPQIAAALGAIFQSSVSLEGVGEIGSLEGLRDTFSGDSELIKITFQVQGSGTTFHMLCRPALVNGIVETLASESVGEAASAMQSGADGPSKEAAAWEAGQMLGEEGSDVVVRPVAFQELTPQTTEKKERPVQFIRSVPLEITVELGRSTMTIGDIMRLEAGRIVELDRLAGENVDILINGRLVAKGEVVVIDDYFGVKIGDIVGVEQRT